MFSWKFINPQGLKPTNPMPKNDDVVDPYHQQYIDKNRSYFNQLLGSRLIEKDKVQPLDIIILKEAYDKAHSIRNFEIDLFWKRATYCFTIIAALITLCGGMYTSYSKPDMALRDKDLLVIIACISFIGVLFTIMSNLMMVSGEYWKKNWELHISMLEPLFSGRIYSTHLVSSEIRCSITRILQLFFMVIYIGWLAILGLLVQDNKNFIIPLGGVISASIIFILIFSYSKNKTQHVYITSYSVNISQKKSKIEEVKRFFLNSIKILLLFSIYAVTLLACYAYYIYDKAFFSFDFIKELFS